MRIIVKIVLGVVALLVLLVTVALIRTATSDSRQRHVPAAPALAVDEARAAENLAAAIRFVTIASDGEQQDRLADFHGLHAHLAAAYPRVHQALAHRVINDSSLLFSWPGRDPTAKAIVLMAHLDVVPVAPGTESAWQHEPFAGVVADGFVWGRGAWDDKGNVIAQLEAVEALLARGFQPERSVYLVFGGDEEIGGQRGAKAMATLLQQQGVQAEFVIDEGMLITEGMIAGLSAPAALIGVAEKGYLSTRISVLATPGHSSMPPTDGSSAISQLNRVLQRIEAHPLPLRLDGVARDMLETLAPDMHGFGKLALTNLWLFEPLVQQQLAQAPATHAMLTTTTAFTMLSAGNKDNVLPGEASATINFRLLPGTGIDDVLAYLNAHTAQLLPTDRFRIEKVQAGTEPSPVSPKAGSGYQLIEQTVRELQPDTLVAPGLMLGGTDSRHFTAISDQIYRFSPIRAKPEDLPRFHGNNERLSLQDLSTMIRFYQRLLEQAAGPATAVAGTITR